MRKRKLIKPGLEDRQQIDTAAGNDGNTATLKQIKMNTAQKTEVLRVELSQWFEGSNAKGTLENPFGVTINVQSVNTVQNSLICDLCEQLKVGVTLKRSGTGISINFTI